MSESDEIVWQKTLTGDEAHELLMNREIEKKQNLVETFVLKNDMTGEEIFKMLGIDDDKN